MFQDANVLIQVRFVPESGRQRLETFLFPTVHHILLFLSLGGNCIGVLTTDGSLKIFSLPNLRPLLDIQCGISISDYR